MTVRLETDAIARMMDDLSRADLKDPRRVVRAQRVLERMATTPDATLPNAMVTDAELEGAYRLFSNDDVSFEQLFDAHAVGTAERARGRGVVLALHDTTHCQFRHAAPEEVGYLNTGKPGFPLHLSLLVDPGEWYRPLGLTHAEVLPREKPPRKRAAQRPRQTSTRKPNREFLRWYRGIELTECRLTSSGTQVIHVADRESDAYELMATCRQQGHRFIFRARNNRSARTAEGTSILIRTLIDGLDVALEREVPLSRRLGSSAPNARRTHPPRDGRLARLRFSATTVSFRRPSTVRAHMPATLEVNVLHVSEPHPPVGQEAVDWLLYTTEPLETPEQIENVVDYYRSRWQIEELHKALKTGCVVQERRLESFAALTTMLALSLPIAVELLALRTLARADKTSPAKRVMTPQQLTALRHISHRPLPDNPTIQDALWCIAGLGGHIKNNGDPGWQVLQRGMEKFIAFAAGWCAREEAADL